MISVLAAFSLFAIPSVLASPDIINVNETGWWKEGGTFNASSTPIQHAINNATAGDTINVAAGTYNENIIINKNLTLNGANVGVSGTGTRGTESIIDAAAPADPTVYAVEITANTVTLDGFTITGLTGSGENVGTVMVQGKDYCTITNNILTDNYKDGISLYATGGAYSDHNTVSNNLITSPNDPGGGGAFAIKIKGSHNTISGNTITDGWRWAIHLWSYDASETVSPDHNVISGNTITGTGAYDERGIVCKTGAYTEVTDNTITGVIYAPIYFYTSDRIVGEDSFDPRPSNVTISGNTITGGEAGIALLEGCNNFTVSGNTITGGAVQGKTTQAGILGGLSRWPNDWVGKTLAWNSEADYHTYLQITNNTISGNTIDDCGHGIAMQHADRNNLTSNTITGNINTAAIDWWSINTELEFTADYAGVYFDANSTGNVVNYNSIVGNTGGLKNANTGETLDAECNWWSDVSGPYHDATNPCGTGDNVSDNVTYRPWSHWEGQSEAETATTTVSGTDPPNFDTTAKADTEVDLSGLGAGASGSIAVAKYPATPSTTTTLAHDTGKTALKYVDVQVGNLTQGNALIKVHYTSTGGLEESSLRLYYWDGSSWMESQSSSVDTANDYVQGVVPVTKLTGTPCAAGGSPPAPAPPAVPVPEFNAIGLLALIGILTTVIAFATLRKRE